MDIARAPSCSPSESLQPPAKRARLSKSPEPFPQASSPPATTAEYPSSSALTLPTSSAQAVDHSLSAPQPRSPSPQQDDVASPPPPATANSDFDDLDWDWLDNGEELEKNHRSSATKQAKDHGKGKGPAIASSRQRPSPAAAAGPSTYRAPAAAPLVTPARSSAQVPQQVFFQTASNKKLAVSDVALREAMKRFEAWEAEEEDPLPAASTSATATTNATPRATPFKPPTIAPTRPAQPIPKIGSSRDLQTTSLTTPNPSRFSSPRPTGAPAAAAHTPLPQRHQQALTTPASSTLRRPLAIIDQATSDNLMPGTKAHSPSKKVTLLEHQTLLNTPKQPHLSTGLRRTAAPSTRARTKFSTPFKRGVRPADAMGSEMVYASPVASSSMSTASPTKRLHAGMPRTSIAAIPPPAAPPSNPVPVPVPIIQPQPTHRPIFDLTPPLNPRLTLAQSGIIPESISATQAQSRGAPNEIFVILKHPDLAKHYVFDDASLPGVSLGPAAALEMLRKVAGEVDEEVLNLKWVQNHWGLILWKLAALVRHRPEDVFRLWTWGEMCRQLRYRYEREVNRAERSAIKRIQEHDASSTAPMILCVRAVLPGAPHWTQQQQEKSSSDDATGPSSTTTTKTAAYTLELTDGWYRIRASVDAVLGRAIGRGRIKAGVKIAVRGAKLHSGHEGTHVLDALEKSGLSLTGNSTSLARWDTRLGFSKMNFVACLRSLTPDGGCVACMDVVLTKVHPKGYVDVNPSSSKGEGGGGNMSNARSEAEEVEAEEKWRAEVDALQVGVQGEMEARGERWVELGEIVEEWVERVGGAGPSDGEESGESGAEEACERTLATLLVEGEDARRVLKEASDSSPPLSTYIHSLSTKLRARAQQDREDAVLEAQRKVQELCPPRRTRSFRVIRFVDAAAAIALDGEGGGGGAGGQKKLKRSKRTVQLTLWDAAELEEKVELVEGGRYLVFNLQPIFKQSWRGADVAADVYLCTRRNTTWKKVG
ncbi:hypothetical protein CF319_g1153 [Tilletia indica]|nr:hypothetical protein CF319_g1153 [Tilletia indica]